MTYDEISGLILLCKNNQLNVESSREPNKANEASPLGQDTSSWSKYLAPRMSLVFRPTAKVCFFLHSPGGRSHDHLLAKKIQHPTTSAFNDSSASFSKRLIGFLGFISRPRIILAKSTRPQFLVDSALVRKKQQATRGNNLVLYRIY